MRAQTGGASARWPCARKWAGGRAGGMRVHGPERRGRTVTTGPPGWTKIVRPSNVAVSGSHFPIRPLQLLREFNIGSNSGNFGHLARLRHWVKVGRSLAGGWAVIGRIRADFSKIRQRSQTFGRSVGSALRALTSCVGKWTASLAGNCRSGRQFAKIGPMLPTLAPKLGQKLADSGQIWARDGRFWRRMCNDSKFALLCFVSVL